VPCIRGGTQRSMRASLEDEVRATPNHSFSNSGYTAILRAPNHFDSMSRGSDFAISTFAFSKIAGKI
jgi:hypothetical protein